MACGLLWVALCRGAKKASLVAGAWWLAGRMAGGQNEKTPLGGGVLCCSILLIKFAD